MSERINLRDIGIESSQTWYLDSPTMLGEYVAGLSSGYQALFLDGLARGFEDMGALPAGHQLWWINDGVRGLGDTRAKAVRDFVAELHYQLNEETPA